MESHTVCHTLYLWVVKKLGKDIFDTFGILVKLSLYLTKLRAMKMYPMLN